jgi:mono/diheme cytochrome c family protein
MENPDPKPLPIKAIAFSLAGLLGAGTLLFLVLPAFFDIHIGAKYFHNDAPPWAGDAVKAELTKAQSNGKDHFQANCASCHGPTGKGNGPSSVSLRKRPPSFVDPNAKFINGYTKDGLEMTIRGGVNGTEMPAFGHLNDQVVGDLVAYLLWIKENASLL